MSKNALTIQGEIYIPYVEYQQIENDRYDMKNVVIPSLRAQVTVLKEVLKLNNISLPKEIEHER
tara:strand:+ start:1888 stop:2079 length:192 start_codon:yes stop_codon:yes gene_type:complete